MTIVTVDLTTKSIIRHAADAHLVDDFVGGRGTNTRLFYEMTGEYVDPLAGECPVILGTGPLTGTPFPMAGRFEATSRSPLTGTIFTSSCGGRMGVYLKKCSIDTLVIKGVAEAPCYLSVEGGSITICDAEELWGQEKAVVKERLKAKHGRGASVLLIGKAGENGVLFANIENDGRFLGRGGLGAILGAKCLKGIVATGKGKTEIADKDGFNFLRYECRKWLSANPITSKGLSEFGTGILLNYMREVGLLSTKNFRDPAPFESSLISGEMVTSSILKRRKACFQCPIACGRVTVLGDGPEYETLWALGVNLGIYDISKVAELNRFCNENGLDTITMGSVLGMALELAETGRLSLATGYNDPDGIRDLITATVEKRGVGELLAMGTKKLGELYHAEDIAAQVKGLELPAYDPRGAYGHALGYATSNRGGCHMQGYLIGAEVLGVPKMLNRHSVEGKASLLALYQNVSAFMDSLVMCRFSSFALPHDYYARMASAVTGRRITWEDSITIGERIWNTERLINLRDGVDKDSLPLRFKDVPIKEMLDEYYAIRGWDSDGRPTGETLNRLSLL